MTGIVLATLISVQGAPGLQHFGKSIGYRVVREGGLHYEEVYIRDSQGKMKLVMASPGHSKVKKLNPDEVSNALSLGAPGLYADAPNWHFTKAEIAAHPTVPKFKLSGKLGDWSIEKTVAFNAEQDRLDVTLIARHPQNWSRIHYLVDNYAFIPNGSGKRPTRTFAPGLRPSPRHVIGDHFFRSPAVIAERDSVWAAVIPSTDSLAKNRPIPAILELDAMNGVVDATLMGYGLCDHKLDGHVSYVTDPSLTRQVPAELRLDYEIHAGSGEDATSKVAQRLWDRDGRRFFDRVLPQVMPFNNAAKLCFAAAFKEKAGDTQIGWFEHKIGDYECGGVPAGWGYTNGWVSWQCWFNNLRSAYGIYAWGRRTSAPDLKLRGAKMLNLALAAPLDKGACPTTYDSFKKAWIGCLIKPSPDCYYDLPSMAWKGYWLLRFIQDFPDCPRKDDALAYAKAMADCMLSFQRADGAIPSWLTKDHKVVSILDASAQTALPAWFFAELYGFTKEKQYFEAAGKAIQFLVKNVIPQNRYYDFETFFSCSPKTCLQRNGKIDDEAMHDPHTLCPPQNTLCMQWSAEAIRVYVNQGGSRDLLPYAFQALDVMNMYQATWNISYRNVAYTFGGFSVQNSDGEYLDARQAQFGATLCDFGAQFGRRDWFERGVAATRAGITLINHPLHIANGLYPNPNYPFALEPENCGHSGWDSQNGRTGFDWGEGSTMTSAAYILDRYGDVFVHDQAGWSVGIDGVRSLDPKATTIEATMWSFPAAWTGAQRLTVKSFLGSERTRVEPQLPAEIRDIAMEVEGNDVVLIAIPGFTSTAAGTALSGQFMIGKNSLPATLGPKGFTAKLPIANVPKSVAFEGMFGSRKIARFTKTLLVDPTFDFADWRMPGWSVRANFPEVPTRSKRRDFDSGAAAFIGTCEDGRGGFDDTFVGEVRSPEFLVTKAKMVLRIGGGAGKDVRVELLNDLGVPVITAHGKNEERMEEVVWDVAEFRGQTMRLQVVDHETGPWGHINLGRVSFRD
ncbi:MAG: hypothetical protein HONBIEJF_00652 [Fimbriimonadaceae bacterium]|nr:hypothetical protein [Fimbriimonadaceae bacterium]